MSVSSKSSQGKQTPQNITEVLEGAIGRLDDIVNSDSDDDAAEQAWLDEHVVTPNNYDGK